METGMYVQTLAGFLAPIRPLLDDPAVSEVMINGSAEIYAEREGRLERVPCRFEDEHSLQAAVKHMAQYVGRELNPQHPVLDGRLPDGSRVHVVLPPAARNGIVVAIRRFRNDTLTLERLIDAGALTREAAAFLHAAVNVGKNILVSGGTGTGKTSLLNLLTGMIDNAERIVVIEDAAELQPRQPHVVSLETRPADRQGRGQLTIRDLFRSALRLRPDRVIIGEIRGGEAMDMIQAMTSGHHGSMSTLHANSPYDALHRLETMALMSDVALPLRALRSQISSAIDVVVQVARLRDGSRRTVSISEVRGLTADDHYQVLELFRMRLHGRDGAGIRGTLEPTGEVPHWLEEVAGMGIRLPWPLPWGDRR